MRFLVSTKNEILLFLVFCSFGKIFLLKMFSKIKPNAFSSPFSISSENENRKQPNQTPPYLACNFIFNTPYVSHILLSTHINCFLFWSPFTPFTLFFYAWISGMTRVAFKSLEIATRSGIYKNKNTVVKLQTMMENHFSPPPQKKKKNLYTFGGSYRWSYLWKPTKNFCI